MTYQQSRETVDLLRSTPLDTVLRLMDAIQDRHDKAKWHTKKGPISISGMKFFNWTRQHGGGGAIDLTIHLLDLSFREAVKWLAEHHPLLAATTFGKKQPVCSSQTRLLRLPISEPRNRIAVRRYLIEKRALSALLVDALFASKRLYADQRANAVFLMQAKGPRTVGAELRGTTNRVWRGLAPGTRKDHGFFYIHGTHITAIVLCEAAIDALSCHILHPKLLCISTAGARPRPQWIPPLIRKGYPVYCGFDANEAGDQAARQMISTYPCIRRLRPSRHDWNEVLINQPVL